MWKSQPSERAKDVFLLALIGLTMTGCATLAQMDYIERPPVAYQKPNTVTVEFMAPEQASLRCIERGLLVPAYACGSYDRITLPNPCEFQGQYATMVCHELGRSNGWGTGGLRQQLPPASESPEAKALKGS